MDAAVLKRRRQKVFEHLGGFSQQGAVCNILGKKKQIPLTSFALKFWTSELYFGNNICWVIGMQLGFKMCCI